MAENLTKIISDFSKGTTTPQSGVEFKPRLSPKLIDILNTQIKNELYSSQLYRSIASWLDDKGYVKTAQVFFKYADEELEHMRKIYQYMYDRNCKAITPTHQEVPQTYESFRAVFELTLNHEFGVTANWEGIAKMAREENCNTTYFFTQWFVNEQVEEENKAREILFKLDQGMPEWFVEQNM